MKELLMMELLLSEMGNDDFDWFQQLGKVQDLVPGQVLIESNQLQDRVYFLLSGALDLILPYQEATNQKTIGQISWGSWIGAPYLPTFPPAATLQSATACQILSFDPDQLADKLSQAFACAAHFYRMQAILVMKQIQSVMMQFKIHPITLYQINVKEASSLFAELPDSQLDWLVAVGQRQQLPGGSIVQAAYRPIQALHIVLDGALSLGGFAESPKSLSDVYFPIAQQQIQEAARLGRGDVFGELRSLQSIAVPIPIHIIQVQTLRDCDILSIPYWRIFSKLLHDAEFAMH